MRCSAKERALLIELLNDFYSNKLVILQDHLEVVNGNDEWNGKFKTLNSLSIVQLSKILEEVAE